MSVPLDTNTQESRACAKYSNTDTYFRSLHP